MWKYENVKNVEIGNLSELQRCFGVEHSSQGYYRKFYLVSEIWLPSDFEIQASIFLIF